MDRDERGTMGQDDMDEGPGGPGAAGDYGKGLAPVPEHHMLCRSCGLPFDMRDLDQVVAHEHDGLHEATGIRGTPSPRPPTTAGEDELSWLHGKPALAADLGDQS